MFSIGNSATSGRPAVQSVGPYSATVDSIQSDRGRSTLHVGVPCSSAESVAPLAQVAEQPKEGQCIILHLSNTELASFMRYPDPDQHRVPEETAINLIRQNNPLITDFTMAPVCEERIDLISLRPIIAALKTNQHITSARFVLYINDKEILEDQLIMISDLLKVNSSIAKLCIWFNTPIDIFVFQDLLGSPHVSSALEAAFRINQSVQQLEFERFGHPIEVRDENGRLTERESTVIALLSDILQDNHSVFTLKINEFDMLSYEHRYLFPGLYYNHTKEEEEEVIEALQNRVRENEGKSAQRNHQLVALQTELKTLANVSIDALDDSLLRDVGKMVLQYSLSLDEALAKKYPLCTEGQANNIIARITK